MFSLSRSFSIFFILSVLKFQRDMSQGIFFWFIVLVLLIHWICGRYSSNLSFAIGLFIFCMKLPLFGYWTSRINPCLLLFVIYISISFLLLVHILDFFDYILQPFHWTFISDNSMLRFQKHLPIFCSFFLLIASFSFCVLWTQPISVNTGLQELAVIARVSTIYDSSPQTIIPLLFTRTFQFLTLGVRVWLQVLQQWE